MKLKEFYNDLALDEIIPATSTTTPAQDPAAVAPKPTGQMATDPMKAAADAKAAQAQAAAQKQEQIKEFIIII